MRQLQTKINSLVRWEDVDGALSLLFGEPLVILVESRNLNLGGLRL